MARMANTPKTRKALGRRLVALREKQKLTQADAAERIGVSRETWQSWETGRRAPTGATLKLIGLLESGKL